MNNLLIKSPSSHANLSKVRQATPFLKLVVFTIGGLNLALRIESVYKVVNHTPVYSSGLNHVGITHLGDSLRDSSASQEVTVVDLHWRFFKSSQASDLNVGGYLVIVKTATGELYGIPVPETPVLIEVPLSTIRAVPESYRRADTLEVASHVAVIPQEGNPLTVFLLDVGLLLPIFEELSVEV